MKFKNFAKMLLSCVLAGALFTGCGGSQTGDKPAQNNDEVKLGMLTHLNAKYDPSQLLTEARRYAPLAELANVDGVYEI